MPMTVVCGLLVCLLVGFTAVLLLWLVFVSSRSTWQGKVCDFFELMRYERPNGMHAAMMEGTIAP